MSSVCFICQGCRQPLEVAKAAETLGLDTNQRPVASELPSAQGEPGETLEEGPASKVETDTEKLRDSASCRHLPRDGRMSRHSPHTFTLLGSLNSGRTLHSIQKTMRGIFDILSGEEDQVHPLCQDCTDSLLEQLDIQLTVSESDSQNYKRCLEIRESISEAERELLQEELKDVELQEMRLVQELAEVEKNQGRAAVALKAAQTETETLAQQERWDQREYRELQWQRLELEDEHKSVENRLRYAQTQLAWLEKSNAFRSTFEICHDGPLATINNCRWGCHPTVPMCWTEINAAWGQMALLLCALSNTIGLEFQRFQLIPCGSHSYLKSLTDDTVELPLFCNGGQNAFLYSKFDQAMMAFLDCMQQFKEAAEKVKSGVYMPYRIHVEKGLMEDPRAGGEFYSIRTHLNSEEQWTKALKLS